MSAPTVLWVGMDYPGKVISVNHCYRRDGERTYLHQVARRWRDTLAEGLHWQLGGVVGAGWERRALVRIDCHYVDEAHGVDPANLSKLVFDAVQGATGINDRVFQPAAGLVEYGVVVPSIVVTVTLWRVR